MSIEIKKPTRSDWCFSDIPEEELTACIFWEYARESPLKELGPKVDLHKYPQLTQVNRRLINALLGVDALEIENPGSTTEAPVLEGFFQEVNAWQDLSARAKKRFQVLFEDSFVWTTTDYDLGRELLDSAESGSDKTPSSKSLMLLLTSESLRTCSNKFLIDVVEKKISEFREGEAPSMEAKLLKGLFGGGITTKKRRSYLAQLGAYRLLSERNRPTDLVDAFSEQLEALVREEDNRDTWLEPSTWSKAKKKVESRVNEWFPLS